MTTAEQTIKDANKIVIFSGSRDSNIGTFNEYNGKRTFRAVKSRLTRERCGGDKWAALYVSSDSGDYVEDTYFEFDIERNEVIDLRTIEPHLIVNA